MLKRLKRAWDAFMAQGEFRYGDDKTLHRSGEVNVELGPEGDVVSVWFRCAVLPFTESRVDHRRAADMRQCPIDEMPRIQAIVFEEV